MGWREKDGWRRKDREGGNEQWIESKEKATREKGDREGGRF